MPRILGSNTVRRNVVGFLPAILWAILVILLSLSSITMVPKFSWSDIAGFDKAGHLVFYCILALWVMYGFFRIPRRYPLMVVWTAILCISFGVSMELLQAGMRTGRQFEYLDILANVVGVGVAYILYHVFLKRKYHGNQ